MKKSHILIYGKRFITPPINNYNNLTLEFKNVQDFLNSHNIEWVPPNDSAQHGDEELAECLEQAKFKFKAEPLILKKI